MPSNLLPEDKIEKQFLVGTFTLQGLRSEETDYAASMTGYYLLTTVEQLPPDTLATFILANAMELHAKSWLELGKVYALSQQCFRHCCLQGYNSRYCVQQYVH